MSVRGRFHSLWRTNSYGHFGEGLIFDGGKGEDYVLLFDSFLQSFDGSLHFLGRLDVR
jgi:hypothetical protein